MYNNHSLKSLLLPAGGGPEEAQTVYGQRTTWREIQEAEMKLARQNRAGVAVLI